MPKGDELTILAFWLTLFAAFTVESVKAETTTRRIAFGGLACVFLLSGLFWSQLQKMWPPLTAWVTSVATSPTSWFVLLIFIAAVFAFHLPNQKDATRSSPQWNNTSCDPIYFAIQKSYFEVSCREFHGKSIVRCAAVATNRSEIYLDGCKFTAETEINVFERASEEFSGNLPPGGTARLHLFDLLIQNIGGEFLGYRFLAIIYLT
jgi:hypothetical protein